MLLQEINQGVIPQLVMFDLDGTLVDSVPDLAYAVNGLLADVSAKPVAEEQVRQWVGNGARKLVERALGHVGFYREEDINQGLDRFKAHYREHCAVDTRLYEGTLACLHSLRDQGISMGIVTNKPREFVPPILKSLCIDEFFGIIVGGDDLPERKPSPAPLLSCVEQYGCKPAQAVMVGDSRNDIEAARRAGIAVAAVDYGYNHGNPIEDEQPDVVVSTLTMLC